MHALTRCELSIAFQFWLYELDINRFVYKTLQLYVVYYTRLTSARQTLQSAIKTLVCDFLLTYFISFSAAVMHSNLPELNSIKFKVK